MSEIKKVKSKGNKRQLSRPALLLLIGILIIAIPCLIFGGILLSSAFNTGSPVFGDRYVNDLDPAITNDDMNKIKESISSIEGVESVEVVLPSGQLRVNIDTKDDLDKKKIEAITKEAYKKVGETLAIDTYFKSTEDKRMYDLAINVYNKIDSEKDDMIYYELTKNAKMEKEHIQLVSEPLNKDLVDELNKAQNPDNSEEEQKAE